eukprot:1136336-Pelagomonas_calceolata.AAC.4
MSEWGGCAVIRKPVPGQSACALLFRRPMLRASPNHGFCTATTQGLEAPASSHGGLCKDLCNVVMLAHAPAATTSVACAASRDDEDGSVCNVVVRAHAPAAAISMASAASSDDEDDNVPAQANKRTSPFTSHLNQVERKRKDRKWLHCCTPASKGSIGLKGKERRRGRLL